MAKSPRKGATAQKSSGYSQKLNPKLYNTPKYGGKNFKAYNYLPKKQRRWSIADSSSGASDEEKSAHASKYVSDSDSESSLTAMSENDESQVSRRGSVFFEETSKGGNFGRKFKPHKARKGMKSARKQLPKKKLFTRQEESSDDEDENDAFDEEDDGDEQHILDYGNGDDENEDESAVGLGGIYSMINTKAYSSSDNDDDDSESSSNGGSAGEDVMSSSDDSEVDFVQLQAERRAKSMKNLRAIKGLKNPKTASTVKGQRRGSIYRRKSEVALPEDINFKFEFDHEDSISAIEEDDDNDDENDGLRGSLNIAGTKTEEEDIGEVVNDDGEKAEFHFDEPLMHVPKFKDDEFNSEEEYEFDDNDLLATLQADNDLDEFINGDPDDGQARTRQGSLSSMNDDTEDPFLREEEKYLVNEFETNGFDDEEDPIQMETARVMDSFKDNNAQKEQVMQYASSSDGSNFGDDDEMENENDFNDGDVNDYIDFVDFAEPIMDKKSEDLKPNDGVVTASRKSKKPQFSQRHKRKGPLDSEEEDDSYLWNYFFSSDAESEVELDNESFDVEEQLMLEEIFRKDMEEKKRNEEEGRSATESVEDPGYDSGESTDVDLSLPASNQNQSGSKVAKEVLSSKTADYRPPVLGTWVAIESQPFGIIDGLSTRTLNNQNNKNPRGKGWKNFSINDESEDLAIELDELLNISELDNDDENDVRIWRDFNNNKKHVPLGAFRNKLHMNPPMVILEPMQNFGSPKSSGNQRAGTKYDNAMHAKKQARAKVAGSLSKKLGIPSKQKRRRASIADAVSEGFRPTKSGLFSENVLADVEEMLGDDREFMALIKGL